MLTLMWHKDRFEIGYRVNYKWLQHLSQHLNECWGWGHGQKLYPRPQILFLAPCESEISRAPCVFPISPLR